MKAVADMTIEEVDAKLAELAVVEAEQIKRRLLEARLERLGVKEGEP